MNIPCEIILLTGFLIEKTQWVFESKRSCSVSLYFPSLVYIGLIQHEQDPRSTERSPPNSAASQKILSSRECSHEITSCQKAAAGPVRQQVQLIRITRMFCFINWPATLAAYGVRIEALRNELTGRKPSQITRGSRARQRPSCRGSRQGEGQPACPLLKRYR